MLTWDLALLTYHRLYIISFRPYDNFYEVEAIIMSPTLQMRKPRHKEINPPAHRHRANEHSKQDLDMGPSNSRASQVAQ